MGRTFGDLGTLLLGLVVGWFLTRRALSTAWSRHGRAVGAGPHGPTYREVSQEVPIPGAGRGVRIAVAYLVMLALVSLARIGWAWETMQAVYDHGHRHAALVPKDASGIVLVVLLAAQTTATVTLLPRAIAALVWRRPAFVLPATATIGLGLLVAVVDFVVLYRATSDPDSYWVRDILVDDLLYAVLCLLGLFALLLLARAERRAPPIAAAAIRGLTPAAIRRAQGLTVGAIVVATMVTGHAFFYARIRYQVSREIDGEALIAIHDRAPIVSDDKRFVYWLPDGPERVHDGEKRLKSGTVKTHWLLFSRGRTTLRIEWWARSADHGGTLAELCPEDAMMTGATTCDTGKEWVHERIVLDGDRVYEISAEPPNDPASLLFLESFHPRTE